MCKTTIPVYFICFFFLFFFSGCGCSSTANRPEKPNKISNVNYKKEFNDLNDRHLSIAQRLGVESVVSRSDVEKRLRSKLVELDDKKAYVVDDLTHSIPFLIPRAADLLSIIGLNFQDSLVMKHLPPYKVIVTSVLRTGEDVKRLGRHNINASKNSAHCYGTTFDISHKRFAAESDEEVSTAKLKLVLGEVLRDLKSKGRCYIKHEVKQACFHITVR